MPGDTRDFGALMQSALSNARSEAASNPTAVPPVTTDVRAVGQEDDAADVEETGTDASPAGKDIPAAKPDQEGQDEVKKDIESIYVTDDKGRRRIDIDFSDREGIKKLVSKAAGADGWKARMDRAEKAHKEVSAAHEETNKALESITATFERQGIKGLINLLTQQEDGFDKWFASEYSKRKQYDAADPATKEVMDARREAEEMRKELELARKEREEGKLSLQKRAEEVAQQEATTVWTSAAKKTSFAGKLGDADSEAFYDEAVQDYVRRELTKLGEDNEIDDAQLSKLFEDGQKRFLRVINVKTDKTVKAELERKKDDVAVRLNNSRGQVKGPSAKDEAAAADIKDGSIAARMRGIARALGRG
jgi:hypothetical protein